jgi:hypothetical protein
MPPPLVRTCPQCRAALQPVAEHKKESVEKVRKPRGDSQPEVRVERPRGEVNKERRAPDVTTPGAPLALGAVVPPTDPLGPTAELGPGGTVVLANASNPPVEPAAPAFASSKPRSTGRSPWGGRPIPTPPPTSRRRRGSNLGVLLALGGIAILVGAGFMLVDRASTGGPKPNPSGALLRSPNAPVDPELAKRLRAAVVVIDVSVQGRHYSMGSGFFVSSDGLIATDLQLISPDKGLGRRTLQVTLVDDSVIRSVDCVTEDAAHGLALIRIAGGPRPALDLMQGDKVNDGTPVILAGHPAMERWSLLRGIVLKDVAGPDGTRGLSLGLRVGLGSSGGPLVLENGEVAGLALFKASEGPAGYGVPAAYLRALMTSGAKADAQQCGTQVR